MKFLRAVQCGLDVTLVVVSVCTALASAIARWTDLLDFNGVPIIGSPREISSILNDTIFQELMVAVFVSSVAVLFVAVFGILVAYATIKEWGKSKVKIVRTLRIIYVVLLSVTLLIEGCVACVLTWFYVGHNGGSFDQTDCPNSAFLEYDIIDVLSCPMDYAIKTFILDSADEWSKLQDIW